MMKVDFEQVEGVQASKVENYRFLKEDGDWVVILARGECRNAGYNISLKKAELDNNQLELTVKFKDPEPGMMVAMVITYPTRKYLLKLTEKPEKVIFKTVKGDILKAITN